VKSGDTLSSISRKHGCAGPDQLARANRLRTPYVIRTGQRLQLVGCKR
jgi:membrane-bound lytic murein transglycosylase D